MGQEQASDLGAEREIVTARVIQKAGLLRLRALERTVKELLDARPLSGVSHLTRSCSVGQGYLALRIEPSSSNASFYKELAQAQSPKPKVIDL